MSLPQSWQAFAASLLPGLQAIYAGGGPPAWVALAMAGHESITLDGIVPADSTYAVENNPWGVRPYSGEPYPIYNGTNGAFIDYPSLLDASTDLLVALGPTRLALADDPTAFMDELQSSGWDGAPPASDGYAASVLGTYGPRAQASLAALGVDLVTAQPPTSAGAGGEGGAAGPPAGSSGSATLPRAAVPLGVVLLGAAIVVAVEVGAFEWIRSVVRGRRSTNDEEGDLVDVG